MDMKYRVVCYMRIDAAPEEEEPLSYEEALEEMENCQEMQPENIYEIELIRGK